VAGARTRLQEKGHDTLNEISIPQEELHFTFARSSGAGGQNVNKVNSKAVLRWYPGTSAVLGEAAKGRFMARYGAKLAADGAMVLMSDRFRDQGRNVADCLDKLKEMIASVLKPPKVRRATKPTFGSKQRRLKAKKEASEKKQSRRWRGD
jgi:ribosome-associated protein